MIDNENDKIEKPVEAEDVFEESSSDPEYHDAEASAHPEITEDKGAEVSDYPEATKYQDACASAHPELLEDEDVEASGYPEGPEDQDAEASANLKVPYYGAIDDGNKNKTKEYFMPMDIDVKNIDKNNKNIWRTIYEAIGAPYFGEVKIYFKEFLAKCKSKQMIR